MGEEVLREKHKVEMKCDEKDNRGKGEIHGGPRECGQLWPWLLWPSGQLWPCPKNYSAQIWP